MAGLVVAWHLPVLRVRENYGSKGMICTNNYSSFGGPKLENVPGHRKSFSLAVAGLACEERRHGTVNMSPFIAPVIDRWLWIPGVTAVEKNPKRSCQLKPFQQSRAIGVYALSMRKTTQAFLPNHKKAKSGRGYYIRCSGLSTIPRPPPNRADDPSLANPLQRMQRMGCGWFSVIMEWEGVIVEDDSELENKSWLALAEEEGQRPPQAYILKRVEGMKSEHAISEVLCWSRDPVQVRKLAARREELYQKMQGGVQRLRPGSHDLVVTLKDHNTPIAIASTRPREYLEAAIESVGMQGFFNVVVAAEDVCRGKPDPEMFMYAAQLLKFISERCIVFGNSNTSVEAAHDICMKCVAVAGKHPVYELGAADLVVRRLDELSIVDLKNLADIDSPEFQPPEPEPEPELEPEVPLNARRRSVATEDCW